MELGNGCLLGLSSREMLNVVDLHVGHKCVPVGASNPGEEECHVLLSTSGDGATNSNCITSSMDFEFSNNDLGTNDFSMEHSSMFDLPESVIDDNEKVELFTDSGLFDEHTMKNNGEVESMMNFNLRKLNLYKELGLKLQVIPLNNLQFVSTVQTNEGVHILALPAGSSYRDCGTSNTLISNIILQSGATMNPEKPSNHGGVETFQVASINNNYTHTNAGLKNEVINLVPRTETHPTVQNDRNIPVEYEIGAKVVKCIEKMDIANVKQTNIALPQPVSILTAQTNDNTPIREAKSKGPLVFKGSKSISPVSPITSIQVSNKMVSLLKSKSQRSKTLTFYRPDQHTGLVGPKTSITKKIPIDKKVIVDFQELIPKKTQSDRVSLLKTPLTNKVLTVKKTNLRQEREKQMKVIIRVKTKKQSSKESIKSIRYMSVTKTCNGRDAVRKQDTKAEKICLKTLSSKQNTPATDSNVQQLDRLNSPPASKNISKILKTMNSEENDTLVDIEDKQGEDGQTTTASDSASKVSESMMSSRHQCTVCKAAFLRKGNLLNHMEAHSDISDDRKCSQRTLSNAETDRPQGQHVPSNISEQITTQMSLVTTLQAAMCSNRTAISDATGKICKNFSESERMRANNKISKCFSPHQNVECRTKLNNNTGPSPSSEHVMPIKRMNSQNLDQDNISSASLIHQRPITTASDIHRMATPIDSSAQHISQSELSLGLSINGISQQQESSGDVTDTGFLPTLISKKAAVSVSEFRCDLCHMTFVNEGNLTRHRLSHAASAKGVARRFKCDKCPKTFLQKCDLRRHELQHSQQFPFTCTHCGKGFIRRSDIIIHERFHTREKTFHCDQCSKAYYQSGDLYRHKKSSHADCADFMCPQCGKKYMSHKGLAMHIVNKHPKVFSTA